MKKIYALSLAILLGFWSMQLSAAEEDADKRPNKKGHDRYKTVWIIGADGEQQDVLILKEKAVGIYAANLRKGFQQSGVPNFIISDKSTNAVFGIGGFVAFRTAYDFNNVVDNKDFYPADIPMVGTLDNRQALRMDASNSRLFFRTVVQTENMGPIEAYIESDFRGGNNVFHLRQAYISFMGLLLGQAPSTFADLVSMPNTIDYEGPHAFVYDRLLMIRYHRELGEHWEFAVAAEMPSVSATPGTAARIIDQRVPNVPLYFQYNWDQKKSHVRLAGLLRTIHYADEVIQENKAKMGWGVQLTTSVTVSPTVRLFGQAAYGNGIQNYVQDMNGRGADMVADPTELGRLQILPVLAWHAGAQFNFAKKWQVNTAYSQINTFDKNGYLKTNDAPVYRISQYIMGNVFYHISPAFSVGAEYIYGAKKNVGTDYAKANRVQAQVQFTF